MRHQKGGIMEKDAGRRVRLEPYERDLGRQMFGDLPERALAAKLLEAYAQAELEHFGSAEAAASHDKMVRELEAVMIAELNASEARANGL